MTAQHTKAEMQETHSPAMGKGRKTRPPTIRLQAALHQMYEYAERSLSDFKQWNT